MSTGVGEGTVKIDLPAQMYGSNPAGLNEFIGLNIRHRPAASDTVWEVSARSGSQRSATASIARRCEAGYLRVRSSGLLTTAGTGVAVPDHTFHER